MSPPEEERHSTRSGSRRRAGALVVLLAVVALLVSTCKEEEEGVAVVGVDQEDEGLRPVPWVPQDLVAIPATMQQALDHMATALQYQGLAPSASPRSSNATGSRATVQSRPSGQKTRKQRTNATRNRKGAGLESAVASPVQPEQTEKPTSS